METEENLPVSEIATTAHSPHRQPRERRLARVRARLETKKAAQVVFLNALRQTGDREKSLELIGRSPAALRAWFQERPIFKAAVERIEQDWHDMRAGKIQGLSDKSIETIDFLITQRSNLKTAGDMAVLQLKSDGLLQEKRPEESTADRQQRPLFILMLPPGTGKLSEVDLERLVEGKVQKESEALDAGADEGEAGVSTEDPLA
ncbi:hypothetical protein LCGC14_2763910 [marine sediment metagenome]|uniref:Terminase small subunit n=1 Tax=marine sediment metagenome TaxID=412755 RepID=A0A0F9BPT9_9ZZZZ